MQNKPKEESVTSLLKIFVIFTFLSALFAGFKVLVGGSHSQKILNRAAEKNDYSKKIAFIESLISIRL